MRGLRRAAVLLTSTLVLSACAGGHAAPGDVAAANGRHLPAPLVKRIAVLARSTAKSLGDASVATAEVYGPGSRSALVKASSGEFVLTTARERKGFYLIVLRGHFVCRSCSGPAGAKPPHGTIAANIWSPTAGGTDFGLSSRLPAAMARLGAPAVITLAGKS